MLLQRANLHFFMDEQCSILCVCVCVCVCVYYIFFIYSSVDGQACHFKLCCSSVRCHQTQHCIFRIYVGRISDLMTSLSQLLPNPQTLQESSAIISETFCMLCYMFYRQKQWWSHRSTQAMRWRKSKFVYQHLIRQGEEPNMLGFSSQQK